MKNEKTNINKRIIYRHRAPLLMFIKKEMIEVKRIKSAPPYYTQEQNKFVIFTNTGLSLNSGLISDSISSDSEDTEIEEKVEVIEQQKNEQLVETGLIQQTETDLIQQTETENLSEKTEAACVTCDTYDKKREEILTELLEMYKQDKSDVYTFVPSVVEEIKYPIEIIMNCTEITPFRLNLISKKIQPKVTTNYKEFKVEKETVLEKVTFELNKLTANNIKKVISNIKKLEVKTIDQAKYIGQLIVFNATNEPQYCYQYAVVVGMLKKELKSHEETGMNRKQTAFFGTVLTAAMDILEKKVEWADKKGLNREDYKTDFEYENAFEERETSRYAKKKKTLGTVDFLCNLYNLDIITFKHIKTKLDEFLKVDNEEIIEVLGRFVDKIGEKMSMSDQSDYANMICSYLNKKKDKFDNRVKFYIMDVLDRKKKWKKPVRKTGNLFALLDIENLVQEEVSVEHNEKENKSETQNEQEIANSPELLAAVGNIYNDIKDASGEEDEVLILDSIKMAADKFGKKLFFSTYFSECITNNRRFSSLSSFFIQYFSTFELTDKELFDVFNDHKSNLDEYKIDFPCSKNNYKKLIDQIKAKDLIIESTYNKLTINE